VVVRNKNLSFLPLRKSGHLRRAQRYCLVSALLLVALLAIVLAIAF
jgi:hypothetical protein